MEHKQNTKNDEIAAKGRLETERGLASLRGQPTTAGQVPGQGKTFIDIYDE